MADAQGSPGPIEDPDRAREERAARTEVVARLDERGITVHPTDDGSELATLLESVEEFERTVERHGGDLMVDDLWSSAPDDRHFVVPQRAPGESLRNYVGRINRARLALRRHPNRAD